MKKQTVRWSTLVCALMLTLLANAQNLVLQNGNFHVVVPSNVDDPVKKAATALLNDFQRVMGSKPTQTTALTGKDIEIVVVQDNKSGAANLMANKKSLDDFESHRVYSDAAVKRIYLHGKDMRGTIYAIYTFSEEVLGVPPFWYFASFNPEQRSSITVPGTMDLYYPSPEVRYRAWFPNDQDCFQPFRGRGTDQNEKWLEALLRMKLNTVEEGATIDLKNKTLDAESRLLKSYGIVLTSHHMVFLNSDWQHWDSYWKDVRKTSVPALDVKNFDKMKEYWSYCIDCVLNSGVENLWQVACRGINDNAFWTNAITGCDNNDKAHGEFITKAVTAQYDLICQKTGDKNPFVRMTFYNEVSDLLAKGYVTPPSNSNMLWTYVAARRNHYPAADLQKHTKNVKLGYYFNFQFTSTGSHLAPAEGPWKMEDNYRYLRSKGPVTFSVVNMGNLREYFLDAYCNAKLLWKFDKYDTDQAVYDFCSQYFGREYAQEAAQIYHDYFYSYYQLKNSDFTCVNGKKMDRQYILQDLRYSRCISTLCGKDWNSYNANPFSSDMDGIQKEMVPNLISGMSQSSRRFADVSERAERLYDKLDSRKKQFYFDHCLCYTRFMSHLSDCLYHLSYAYKNSGDDRGAHANIAYREMVGARDALYATQHDQFEKWYTGHRDGPKFDLEGRVNNTKSKANANSIGLTEFENETLKGGAAASSNSAFSGGKKVRNVGMGGTVQLTYNAASDGVYDIYVQYASGDDRRLEATANGVTISRVFVRTGGFSTIGASTIQVKLKKGQNTIVIGNNDGYCPDLDAYKITKSAWTTTDAPSFAAIKQGVDKSSLEETVANMDKYFYLYNVGAKKWVAIDTQNSPNMVDESKREMQMLTKQDDNTYRFNYTTLSTDWGVQGRNTIYMNNGASTKTNSWGTTLIPGFQFVSTGDTDGSVYIEYTWGQWTKGTANLNDPSGKTYCLYYGDWALGTDGWASDKLQDVQGIKAVYGDELASEKSHGDYAKWLIVPVENGTVDVLPARAEEVEEPVEETPTSVNISISNLEQNTYSCKYDLDFSNSEVKAFIATGYNSQTGKILLTGINYVPAGTGVLLKASEGDYEVPVANNSSWIYKNMFVGLLEDAVVSGTDSNYVKYYLSYTASRGLGFYKVGDSIEIKANRAYLQVPASLFNGAAARVVYMDFDDETTGIRELNAAEEKGNCYDLQGRRVVNPKKGAYLRQGHKYVKK